MEPTKRIKREGEKTKQKQKIIFLRKVVTLDTIEQYEMKGCLQVRKIRKKKRSLFSVLILETAIT